MAARAEEIFEVLGGRKVLGQKVSTVDQLTERIRIGLPFAAVETLMSDFDIEREELQSTLALPLRTFARRKKEKRLRTDESDRLVRLANVAAKAAAVLGDKRKAARWLHRSNRALGNRAPLSLLDTDLGARQVEAVLLRIEHGVYS